MASLEGARAHAQQEGIWEEPLTAGRAISKALQELPGLQILADKHVGGSNDCAVLLWLWLQSSVTATTRVSHVK